MPLKLSPAFITLQCKFGVDTIVNGTEQLEFGQEQAVYCLIPSPSSSVVQP